MWNLAVALLCLTQTPSIRIPASYAGLWACEGRSLIVINQDGLLYGDLPSGRLVRSGLLQGKDDIYTAPATFSDRLDPLNLGVYGMPPVGSDIDRAAASHPSAGSVRLKLGTSHPGGTEDAVMTVQPLKEAVTVYNLTYVGQIRQLDYSGVYADSTSKLELLETGATLNGSLSLDGTMVYAVEGKRRASVARLDLIKAASGKREDVLMAECRCDKKDFELLKTGVRVRPSVLLVRWGERDLTLVRQG